MPTAASAALLAALAPAAPAAQRRIVAPNPEAAGWQELFATAAGRDDLGALARAAGLTGFKFMINCVTGRFGYCAEADWGAAAAALGALNVSVGIEAGMFQGVAPGAPLPNSCNGTRDALDDLAKVAALTRAGARIGFWSMDSIFQHTYPYTDASGVWAYQSRADCCNFSVAQAITEGVQYVEVITRALPGVEIGMNEPAPWYWVTPAHGPSNSTASAPQYAMRDRDLADIVPAFHAALRDRGLALSYFHADMPFEFSTGEATADKATNGWQKLAALQGVVNTLGVRFGKYFNSQTGGASDDELFYRRAVSDAESYRAWAGRLPDDVVLESWFPRPSRLLPLAEPYTFLWDARGFFAALRRRAVPADAARRAQWARGNATVAAVQANGTGQGGVTQAEALGTVEAYAKRAAGDGADLVVFPEYFVGAFHAGDATYARVSAAARDHKVNVAVGGWLVDAAVPIAAGCPGQQCAKRYTNAILIFARDGALVGVYNKTHPAVGGPPETPSFWPPRSVNDGEWWMRWGEAYPVFDLDFARIGVQTCYDGYFSEPSAAASAKGAELLLWPNGRGGSIEPFLVQGIVFQHAMHVVATNQAMGTGTMIAAAPGGWAAPSPECGVAQLGRECYIVATLDMRRLRDDRRSNRELHQRRADLAAAELGTDWDTPGFYAGYAAGA